MRNIQQRRQRIDGQRSRHWLGKVLSRGQVKTISQGDHCEQVSNAVEAGSQFWEVTDPYIYQHAGHWFHWHELFFCLFLPLIIFFSFIFISWRLITLQYCSGFCHTLTWISHGFTCIPHPDPPSHLSLHPIPLGLPSAPAPSTCLMHPTWAGDLFHPR